MIRIMRQRAARMNRLVEHRQRLVEEAQRRFAEEQRALAACEGALAEVEESQRQLTTSLDGLVGQSLEPTLLAGAERYQAWLAQRRSEREEALELAKRQAELARAAVIAQRREAKKLELVRERWLSQAQRLEHLAEVRSLDEFATTRVAREMLEEETGKRGV